MAGTAVYMTWEPTLDLQQAAQLSPDDKLSLILNLTQNYQTDDELLSELAAFSNPVTQAVVRLVHIL